MNIRKILVLAANPTVYPDLPLRLEEEAKKIRNALRSSTYRDNFPASYRGAVTADELRKALSEERPAIVHFCGHGTSSGKIVLETEAGNPAPVDEKALSDLFAVFAKSIECVILNACFSEKQAAAINEHVRYVVGMADVIGDKAAIRFSEVFYESLGNDHSYEESYNLAKRQLNLEGVGHHLDSRLLRKAHITSPEYGCTVPAKANDVSGVAATVSTGRLYLLTGGANRTYWPSAEIKYDSDGNWRGEVHVGERFPKAIIRLISVDDITADYIEFYRRVARTIERVMNCSAEKHRDFAASGPRRGDFGPPSCQKLREIRDYSS